MTRYQQIKRSLRRIKRLMYSDFRYSTLSSPAEGVTPAIWWTAWGHPRPPVTARTHPSLGSMWYRRWPSSRPGTTTSYCINWPTDSDFQVQEHVKPVERVLLGAAHGPDLISTPIGLVQPCPVQSLSLLLIAGWPQHLGCLARYGLRGLIYKWFIVEHQAALGPHLQHQLSVSHARWRRGASQRREGQDTQELRGGAGLVSRSILIDLGLYYRLFQKTGLYLVYILMKSLLFQLNYLFIWNCFSTLLLKKTIIASCQF